MNCSSISVLLLAVAPVVAQKKLAISPRILFAKFVYFENQTGSDAVGKNAVAQLQKWGKFQIVTDPLQADLIFLLSSDPYRSGQIIFTSGQSGPVPRETTENPLPLRGPLFSSSTRYAYLTVIDRKTGETLWSGEHAWGGLLTGFNSAGERLVREVERQTTKLESLLRSSRTTPPAPAPSSENRK